MVSVTTRPRGGDASAGFGVAPRAFGLAACAWPARVFRLRLISAMSGRHCTAWSGDKQPFSGAPPRPARETKQLIGGHRDLLNGDPELGERVLHRVGDGGGARDAAALADTLDAQLVDDGRVLDQLD